MWALFIFSFNVCAIQDGQDFIQRFDEQVYPFYKQASKGQVLGKDQNKLAYLHFKNPSAQKVLVVLPGMSEQAAKYSELAYDLKDEFETYVFDHRNQGASQRLTKEKEMTHADEFVDYIDDFSIFIEQVVRPSLNGRSAFLLGHSMGGMISSLYLSRQNGFFKKAVLNSPMHKIKHYGLPVGLINFILSFLNPTDFVITAGPYNWKRKFKTSIVTSSLGRWKMKRLIVNREKKLAGGGVSNKWLREALEVTQPESITNIATKIKIPILILSAQKDLLVDKGAQEQFCHLMKSLCEFAVIKNAYHEILQEKDTMRDEALRKINEFFK